MKIWKKPSPSITPFEQGSLRGYEPQTGMLATLRRKRGYLLWVVLPTLFAVVYYGLIAADQFVTEARYLVRGRESAPAASFLSGMLGGGAGMTSAGLDAQSIRDYLESHDAVKALQSKIDIVSIFRRPEADIVSRLWFEQPSAERLTEYYRDKVAVSFEGTSGITTLSVKSFRPSDSREIAENLLALSENLVNRYSNRAQADTLRVAREELTRAEARVIAAREALTKFREREQSVDPARSAVMALDTIGRMEASLAQTREELAEKSTYLRPDNPQIKILKNRIDAVSGQILQERARLTRGDETVAKQIAAYERLMLEREFSDKQLASATASLETARMEAQRQQLFLIRVVEPNTAEKSLYPRRLWIIFSLFAGLNIAYGVGWLIVAGVREHAA
jgi:capsular polysaccharide transport system permease protein